MRLVRCPRCDHENRAAVSITICDRCGCDISTVLTVDDRPPERDLRFDPEAVTTVEPIVAAPSEPEPPKPEPAPATVRKKSFARRALELTGRLILAAIAVTLGVAGGASLTVGSALASDKNIAGSVAILAAAAALSGLLMMLVGAGADRSQRVTFGLRGVGFLLATLGIWAVTTIAYEPIGREFGIGPRDGATTAEPPFGGTEMGVPEGGSRFAPGEGMGYPPEGGAGVPWPGNDPPMMLEGSGPAPDGSDVMSDDTWEDAPLEGAEEPVEEEH